MALTNLGTATGNIAKAYGENAGGKGFKFPNFPRLSTGIFTLDVALAGGIPLGAVSLFYGNESCGKTSLALRLAAQFQRRFPDRKVCWIDIENSWDDEWVRLHGVNPEEVYLYKPTTAEEAADVARELGMSEDAGLVIVDSLAALSSIQQLEKSAEQVVVAGAAKPSTQLLRNLGAAMTEHAKAGQSLTVIYINQPRNKIGFVMGNPEFLPGPTMQNFQAFLKLRLSAKPILKEKLAAVPIYNDSSARVVKKKFPCIRQEASWQMALYPYEPLTSSGKPTGKKVKPLDINNGTHIKAVFEAQEWLYKDGKDWVLEPDGLVFPTKEAAVAYALENYEDTVSFVVSRLLLLYEDQIKEQIETGKPMDEPPT